MVNSAIIGFGRYVPNKRINVSEIASHWQQDGDAIAGGLGIAQKSVPDPGDDTFTMAFEAAGQAINMSGRQPAEISAVFVGSESHPYAVKPTSGMLVSALQLDPFSHAADLEFACKAGTAGLQIVDSMIRAKQIRYGLAVGSDTAQAKPGDALEYTAAAGAAALVMGPVSTKNALCSIDSTLSFTTDTPDFWRANGQEHPEHGGRFTGEPGYFHHVRTTTEAILDTAKLQMSDIDHVVFHMPNGKFPKRIAKEFGCTDKQLATGFVVSEIGNTYSACSLLGLTHVLEAAKKGERLLLVSYGSGAGCDAFVCTMLQNGVSLPAEPEPSFITYDEYSVLLARRSE